MASEKSVPPVSAPLSSSGFPPSTLAAMLFTMFRMASKNKNKEEEHPRNAFIFHDMRFLTDSSFRPNTHQSQTTYCAICFCFIFLNILSDDCILLLYYVPWIYCHEFYFKPFLQGPSTLKPFYGLWLEL